MEKNNSNLIIYSVVFAACALLWGFFGINGSLVCFGLFHLFMWLNVTVTALCNALVGKTVNGGDSFYRILCIMISSICFGIVWGVNIC
jgi:hypothetical protein